MFDFKKTEEKILNFWDDHKIFQKSLEIRAGGKKRFVFFEGPPTANGRPGIHHFLGRSFKDLFNRYKTMRGYFVLRKAGWDTHGLPVEIEVEKQLGFKNKKDIEEYGIANFNRKAKESVWKYKTEWEQMTRRMGFWVDLDKPYITYESSYMESLWNVLKTIWDKQLLYSAHKVVPFCTRCGTPLAAHEVAQGYKMVKDQSVYIRFKIASEGYANTYILAWTTTPWTLPGNVALAVGNNIDYVAIKNKYREEKLIIAKDLAAKVLGADYDVVGEMKGSELVGLKYQPLFDVPALKSDVSYHVYAADFVSTTDGTGVVHTAVMYGEDDYNLGTQLNLPKIHTVTELGKFTGVGGEFEGKYVKSKDTEDLIIKYLEQNGNLLRTEEYEHEYPFCWRCGTALLYYAKGSWFIKMSAVNQQMVKNNQTVNWIPEHIKEGRFGQWIKEGKDWAISRERYWGTPLPIWKCIKCSETRALGSIKELEKQAVGSGNTYYVMRHGFTDRKEGAEGIVSSRLEDDVYHLTEQGKEQARKNLENLRLVEEKVDVIFSSPFIRTRETAEIAGQIFHQKFETDDRLGELHYGLDVEGKPSQGTETKSAESENSIQKRLTGFISDMESKYKRKKILIVTHGAPIAFLQGIAQGMTQAEFDPLYNSFLVATSEIRKLDWRKIPRNDLGELDLHRPYIDEMQLKCKTCSAAMRRIPDLADVWFDSGAMPYAQWHWPFENKDIFKQQFPADFIVEGIDQTRGWFYTLLAVATLLDKGAPYKNVMSLGHVLDEKGLKMSKSKGNIVLPAEIMDKYGVDTTRWYFYTINSPGDSKFFSEKDLKERMTGFMGTLENCLKFFELYKDKIPELAGKETLLDKWLMSRFNGLISAVTAQMDLYDPSSAARAIEYFVVEDFSKWWLRRSRKRTEALPILRATLLELAKLIAPFIPYTAEDIFMRLHAQGAESIHLQDWPAVQKRMINLKLEEQMKQVQETVNKGLAIRKDKQLKVRQPLKSVMIPGKKLAPDLAELIKDELNVKEIKYKKDGELELDLEISEELKLEGYAREVIRQIQDMRKEAGYHFDQPAHVMWHAEDPELKTAIQNWSEQIKTQSILSSFLPQDHKGKSYDVEKEFDIAPGKKLWLGISR